MFIKEVRDDVYFSIKHKYEMGDTVQVACDDIAKGLNALHCIELHIISDLSTVVVL